jgi:Fe-Mn family superoxide dismutase
MESRYPFVLQPLPYSYDALAPAIGEETLHYHHDKHLQTYVDNLNKTLESCPSCREKTLEELLTHLDQIPEASRTAIRNNGGGVYNHQLYFQCLSPEGGGQPKGALSQAIDRAFGSFEQWQKLMREAALGQFGSGYAWLVKDPSGSVSLRKTPNQDCPLSEGLSPLLCVDIWEHAYYLDYRNRRADYVDEWFGVFQWAFVEHLFVIN